MLYLNWLKSADSRRSSEKRVWQLPRADGARVTLHGTSTVLKLRDFLLDHLPLLGSAILKPDFHLKHKMDLCLMGTPLSVVKHSNCWSCEASSSTSPRLSLNGNLAKYTHFTGSKKLWRREGRHFARNETEIIKSRTTKTPLHPLPHK